ncbi:MAG: hypothetical protein FWG63_09915 [Defluviitaleaceae bacterium]|nr:hypothetical protein [Defluviitaleaceae bacterium]
MATETRVAQKDKLYSLLIVKKAYEDADIEVLDTLTQTIQYAKAVMEPEDVAYIEKHVAEL